MPTKDQLIEELNFLSDTLTDRTRWIAAGVLAFCWAFVIEGQRGEVQPFLEPGTVTLPIILALLALLLDFSQYWFGYVLNMRMLKSFPPDRQANVPYDTRALLYRLRIYAFSAKIVFALSAAIWLIIVLTSRMMEVLEGPGNVVLPTVPPLA